MVPLKDHQHVVDVVGTGGDGAHTFNISTAATFVAPRRARRSPSTATARCPRAAAAPTCWRRWAPSWTSRPSRSRSSIETVGVGFMFAPSHHPAMKYAAPVRKELGVRTIFNILGPLTNPAGAQNQLLGVFHPDLVGIQTRVLQRLGAKHVMVVYGRDGLDEISISGETLVGELAKGEIKEYELHPSQFGLEVYDRRAIQVSIGRGIEADDPRGAGEPARARRSTSWC